jgi:ferredoxin
MARVRADTGKCEGHANCQIAAPDFFDLDEDGTVETLQDTVDETHRAEVEEAVRNCPVDALRIEQ